MPGVGRSIRLRRGTRVRAHNRGARVSAFAMLASELYSLPILRPLAAQAQARGHAVAWLAPPRIATHLLPGERRLRTRRELDAFATDALIATVHRIPPQLPGKHVQVFHGLNIDKRDPVRGHFRIRGLFDLYCTHGPATTGPFLGLAREHGHFAVVETGWSKLDPLFAPTHTQHTQHTWRDRAAGRPTIMLASTFTESLSAARWIHDALRTLIARGDRFWLLTLHPKIAPDVRARYRALEGPNALFLDADQLPAMLLAADVLVCDTSSVVEEFALLGKPMVTLRHRRPKPFMLDITVPEQLDGAITYALTRPPDCMPAMAAYANLIHPTRDGHAAARVVDATERLLAGDLAPLRPRPRSLWRRLTMRDAMEELFAASN